MRPGRWTLLDGWRIFSAMRMGALPFARVMDPVHCPAPSAWPGQISQKSGSGQKPDETLIFHDETASVFAAAFLFVRRLS